MTLEQITRLLSLASKLEDEGQLNNAKLLRAAIVSLLTRAAYQPGSPTDKVALLSETDWAIEALSALNIGPELIGALGHARSALAGGRLSHYADTPDPFVCRTCGYLALSNPVVCPICGAQPATFNHIRPIFWLEALDPFAALDHLRSTPEMLAALLANSTEAQVNLGQEDGSWSLRQAITHLRDAQDVLAFRVNLILDHENPLLESKAVFEWATNESERPVSLVEIFDSYCDSRLQTIDRLESIPLLDWRRRGQHEEFGELRLSEQVSYFTCHELIHLPQIQSLAAMAP